MRRFTLVEREHSTWTTLQPPRGVLVADAIRRVDPDALVVDDGDFPPVLSGGDRRVSARLTTGGDGRGSPRSR